MNYVADRLFEKLSDIGLGDAAAGAGAVGAGALAAGASRLAEAVDPKLEELQEEFTGAKRRYQRNPFSSTDRGTAQSFARSERLAGGARKGLQFLASTPGRVGAGTLAAALGTVGLYGALKD